MEEKDRIKRVVDQLKKNRERKLNGDLIAIPWSLPRLSSILPGVRQKQFTIISAQSKGGKSQLANYLYMFEPIDWYLKNRDSTNITLKVFYFSLEISADLLIISAISYKLFKSYGIIISPDNLQSVFAGYTLDDRLLKIIDSREFQQWLMEFQSIVTIHDDIRNTTGISLTMKSYAESNGHYEYKSIDWQNEDGSSTRKEVIDRYVPDRPDEYVVVLVDHAGLISPQKDQSSLYEAIGELSSKIFLKFRDRWGYSPVLIQQQTANSTDAQYTNRGEVMVERLKPNPEGLADNKSTKNDANLMISLFWPYNYKIPSYNGWDLARIGMNHRELLINLNRNGISSASIDLMFLGACNYFAELPREPSERVYQQIAEYNRSTI